MEVAERDLAGSIWSLGRSVGTPAGLRSVGIREEQIAALTRAALAKSLPSPRPLEYDALHAALHAAGRAATRLTAAGKDRTMSGAHSPAC